MITTKAERDKAIKKEAIAYIKEWYGDDRDPDGLYMMEYIEPFKAGTNSPSNLEYIVRWAVELASRGRRAPR